MSLFLVGINVLLILLWSFSEVESYCPAEDQWKICPSLREKKGSLAAATANNKIFAMGGGNGLDCFSDVEMLDIDVGRWIRTQSMLQKVKKTMV